MGDVITREQVAAALHALRREPDEAALSRALTDVLDSCWVIRVPPAVSEAYYCCMSCFILAVERWHAELGEVTP